MRSFFSPTYDRADLLLSVGCSTLVSAALIVVIPRVGILLFEMLLGLFLIGCAITTRHRLRRQRASEIVSMAIDTRPEIMSPDRHIILLIAILIVVYIALPALLRKTGLSLRTSYIVTLVLLAIGILVKPRLLQLLATYFKTRRDTGKEIVNNASERK